MSRAAAALAAMVVAGVTGTAGTAGIAGVAGVAHGQAGPEVAFDAPILLSTPDGDQRAPTAAWNGSAYLAVWQHAVGAGSEVLAARIAADGTIVDDPPILISASGSTPSVASDGSDYLVSWMDGGSLEATRVGADGVVLDTPPLVISGGGDGGGAVAFGGGNYLAVFTSGPSITAARIATDGTILDPAGIALATYDPTGVVGVWRPAWNGTDFLVVSGWQHFSPGYGEVYAQRLAGDGSLTDTMPFQVDLESGVQVPTGVASDGTDWLVTWTSSSGYPVTGRRVAADGSFLDAIPRNLRHPTSVGGGATTFDGTNYWIASTVSTMFPLTEDVMGVRMAPDGTVLDAAPFTISAAAGSQRDASLVGNGAGVLAVWGDARSTLVYETRAGRVDADTTVLDGDGVLVHSGFVTTANVEKRPAVAHAAASSEYLIVWRDERNGPVGAPTGDVFGVRVDETGAVLDPAAIPISVGAGATDDPTVTSDGTDFLVMWERNSSGTAYAGDLFMTKVSAAGVVDTPGGIEVPLYDEAEQQASPAVVWGADAYLVVWGRYTSSSSTLELQWGILADDLTVSTPTSIFADADHGEHAAAFDGTNFLIVWSDDTLIGCADCRLLQGRRVSPAGAVVDSLPIPIGVDAEGSRSPRVAFDGSNYLVVWSRGVFPSPCNVVGARVNLLGEALDLPFTIGGPADCYAPPGLAFNGSDFVVAWHQPPTPWTYEGGGDILANRVSPAGAILDGAGFAVATTADGEAKPALASAGAGPTLAAYQRNDSAPASNAWRGRLRLICATGPCAAPIDAGPGTTVDAAPPGMADGGIDDAGADAATPPNGGEGSCDCRVAGADRDPGVGKGGALLLLLAAAIALARRPVRLSLALLPASAACLLAATPAAAVTVGAEYGIDPAVSTSTPQIDEVNPAIAWNGTGYLSVWERQGPVSYEIFGARLAADGTVLDAPFLIGLGGSSPASPSVASDGTDYLVVWVGGGVVYAARVSAAGAVVDATPLVVSTTGSYDQASVAYGGGVYLVPFTGAQVAVARVQPDGTVLDGGGIMLTSSPSTYQGGQAAWNGSEFLVVHTNQIDIMPFTADVAGQRIQADGTVVDATPVQLDLQSGAQRRGNVVSDGDGWLVVWTSTSGYPVTGRRLASDLSFVDAVALNLVLTGGSDQHALAVAFDGASYWVSVGQTGAGVDVAAVRLDPGGTVLDSTPLVITNATDAQEEVALAGNGSGVLAAWSDHRNGMVYGTFGGRMAGDGTAVDGSGFTIDDAMLTVANEETRPAMAYAATSGEYLIVWRDKRTDANGDLYAVRVDSTGTILDSPALALSSDPSSDDLPFVASDGTDFMVMWTRGNQDIYYTAVTAAGVVTSPGGLLTPLSDWGEDQRMPRLAWGAGVYLVTWGRSSTFSSTSETMVGWVDAAGDAVSSTFTLFGDGGSGWASFDGTNFLVVAANLPGSGTSAERIIQGKRVAPSATTALDAVEIPIGADALDNHDARVAFDGTNQLVSWWRRAGGMCTVLAARVTPSATVLDLPIAVSAPYACSITIATAALVHDGTDFVIAWPQGATGVGDLMGNRVDGSGAVLDGTGFTISAHADDEIRPALAADGTGVSLAAYQRNDTADGFVNWRARLRPICNSAACTLPPDAGVPDAGPDVPDAGPDVPDAGPDVPDAGPDAAIPRNGGEGGCDCRVAGADRDPGGCEGGALLLLAAAIALARRR